MTDFTLLGARTCTATYAIERAVTDHNPMSVATFEQVVPLCFFARFVAGGFSLSTSTDDGDVNISLNAYKGMRWEYQVKRYVTRMHNRIGAHVTSSIGCSLSTS